MPQEIFQQAADHINRISYRSELTRYKKQMNSVKLRVLYGGLCPNCPFFEVLIERDGVGLICKSENPHDPVTMQQAVRVWETPECEDFEEIINTDILSIDDKLH